MQEIEQLKFKQDVQTGLTFFDKIKEVVRQGQQEVQALNDLYQSNVNRLSKLIKD